jgi:cytochrome c biogenesis protein CcmG, thiol:disulfide interchange protein DsbE
MGVLAMKRSSIVLSFAGLFLLAAAMLSGCGASSTGTAGSSGASSLSPEPEVTFKDLQGNAVPIASLKGKVVLLNFWATWCEPCRGEIPILINLQKQYGDKGFTVLGAAMDDDGAKVVDPFVKTTQFNVGGQQKTMDYPIVLGNDKIASDFGGLIGMPTSFLITKDGKIAKKYMGALTEAQIQNDVQKQLGAS